jgi:hypothetical protein
MDVGVYGKGRNPKSLGEDDPRRFVAHPCERLQKVPVSNHFTARIKNLMRHQMQVLGFGGGEADLPDDDPNLFRV